MLARMTRLTIALPDDLAEKIKEAAAGNVSAWMAQLARNALVKQEADALAQWEAANRDDGWDAERWSE
jgi:hypothetical protein